MKDKILIFFLILLCIQPTRSVDGLDNSSLWLDSDELVTYGIQSYEIIKRESVIPPDYAWFRFPTHHPEKVNWTLDVRLYRVDGEPKLVSSEILNITYASSGFSWGVRLPDEVPATYRFGVIRRDNLDGSEGVLITTVNVRELNLPKFGVKMVLDKTEYRSYEDITYTIINLGNSEITINLGWRLEKKRDDVWEPVHGRGITVVDIPDHVPPNSEKSYTISVKYYYKFLTKGRYRIVRRITYAHKQLTAEFNVLFNSVFIYLRFVPLTLLISVMIYTLIVARARRISIH